jgi:hypothetical protein
VAGPLSEANFIEILIGVVSTGIDYRHAALLRAGDFAAPFAMSVQQMA